MRNVTVDRDDFLVEVIANREAHREVFEEALEGTTTGSRPNSNGGSVT